MSAKIRLLRHSAGERINHWIVALCFLLAGLSGLSFFHPAFYWLSNLFGSGTWARVLHPFFGSVLSLFFLVLILRTWRDNHLTSSDWQWARHMGEILQNKTENLPEVGKYNFGQKLLTKTLLVAIVLLLVSGIVIWQPWFASEFSVPLRRIAVLVHAFSAFVALLCFIVHVYAAYWTRGSIKSMTQGTVSAAWARHHHAQWYKDMTGKSL